MIEYNVKKGSPFFMGLDLEIEITSYICQIIREKNIKVLAYNICRDHVHILLYCKHSELSNIVRILKSKSTYLYKKNNVITDSIKLWAQKYNCSYIETEDKFYNCLEYIKNNRIKHSLPQNQTLENKINR